MNVHSLEVAFENIFEKISGNVELLTELDQKMGDGDLGISVKTGFQGALNLTGPSITVPVPTCP